MNFATSHGFALTLRAYVPSNSCVLHMLMFLGPSLVTILVYVVQLHNNNNINYAFILLYYKPRLINTLFRCQIKHNFIMLKRQLYYMLHL